MRLDQGGPREIQQGKVQWGRQSRGVCPVWEKPGWQRARRRRAEPGNVAACTCLGLWWKGQASTGLIIAWSLWTLQGQIVCERLENIFNILNSVSRPYWNFHFIPWLSSKYNYYITGCQAQLTLNKQSMHFSQLKHFEPCFNMCIITHSVLHTCDTTILYMDVLLPGLKIELGNGLIKTEVANTLLAVN